MELGRRGAFRCSSGVGSDGACRPVDRPAAFPSFCFELVPVCWSRLPGSPTFETMFLHIYLRIDSKMMLHLLLVRLCFNSLKS